MSELELLIDFHRHADRQGPGSPADTLKALDLIPLRTQKGLKIADIGCGTGGQTLTLAQNIDGQVTAVDLSADFLHELNTHSRKIGLQERIRTLERSMGDLDFNKEEFDIIWSEGAIYSIGFEQGIKQWREYLKCGGCLAVSEVTWIHPSPPKEIVEFWEQEYPEIGMASHKIKILEENGYTLVGYFYLEPASWIDNYYKPMEGRYSAFLERHKHTELAKKFVKEYQAESALYQTYQDYFSYGFYVAKKNCG